MQVTQNVDKNMDKVKALLILRLLLKALVGKELVLATKDAAGASLHILH